MSIQITERITTEYIPQIKESISKGLATVAFRSAPELDKVTETERTVIHEFTDNLPEGGLAFSSFGELAELYDQCDNTVELDAVVDEIAHTVAADFTKWENELDSPEPAPYININRSDAVNAILLWQTHPSEDTEAAAHHILHYASYAIPKIRRQAWADHFYAAFKNMVTAYESEGADNLTLSTALRQVTIARYAARNEKPFPYDASNYDSIFEDYS